MFDKYSRQINTIYELNYAGTAMDDFYKRHNIAAEIESLPAIPMESTWSFRPFFSGSYISRFRILEGEKVISIVLEWFNCFEECKQPYYDILPLKKFKDESMNEKWFCIDEVQEIHDHIKFLFENWDKD